MKSIGITFAFLLFVFIAPQQAFSQEKINQKELEEPIDFPGKVPREHPIMKARFQKIGLEEADKLYRKNVPNAEENDYKGNLQVWGFILVMQNGLLEEGSKTQKEYYISEQLKAENNLPTIEKFYDLLLNASSFVEREKLLEISEKFLRKNEKHITSTKWRTEEAKKAKMQELYLAARSFGRQLERMRLSEKG